MPRYIVTPLVDSQIRGLRPRATRYDVRDGRSPGLILTVLPSGRKQWTFRYRVADRQRRHVFGDYPDLTLSEARDAAGRARLKVRNGQDPAAERNAAKAQRADTINDLAAEYLEKHARPRKKSSAEDERILRIDVLPHIGELPVRELTRREVRAVLERIVKRGAPYAANRTLEIVRKMLNWGIRNDWLDANPASLIEKPGIERSRERVLDDYEVRALWALLSRFPSTAELAAPGRKRAMRNSEGLAFCPISPALAAVQKVRLLTAQRGGEVVRMRWQDLDLVTGWWTIPREHSKNGTPHRVPLSTDVIAIINMQMTPVSPAKTEERPIHVFCGRQHSTVADRVSKAGAALSRVLGFEFRGHDLRRTAATRMAAAGVPREHISRVLNHVEGGPQATRVYDRYSYDREKRSALELWSRELRRIIEQEPSAKENVVPPRRMLA